MSKEVVGIRAPIPQACSDINPATSGRNVGLPSEFVSGTPPFAIVAFGNCRLDEFLGYWQSRVIEVLFSNEPVNNIDTSFVLNR